MNVRLVALVCYIPGVGCVGGVGGDVIVLFKLVVFVVMVV